MAIISQWPLPENGIRFLTPAFLVHTLRQHRLSKDLHPLGAGYYPHAYQHHMQRNRHDNHRIIYCVAGLGKVRIGAQQPTIEASDIVCLPKHTEHEYQAHKSDPWSIY